ncbi:MAG: IS30 family transposase [Planctomycetes bacterium]|nr:IS30 family transposase [Planctomycetota bacterium]
MRTYTQLTRDERYQIYEMRIEKKGVAAIARALKRDRSTISRELQRNKGLRGYRPKQAHALAESRRSAKTTHRISEELWKEIDRLLREEWSPEQIAGRLKSEHGILISHEWIYQHVYADKGEGGRLYKHLRCCQKRRKRYGSYDRRGKIAGRVSIDDRPKIVEGRGRIGDWEGDTLVGGAHRGGLVSLVDRKSRLTRLSRVKRKGAEEVRTAIRCCLTGFRSHTLTVDNGTEFTDHTGIARDTGAKVYFAHPYRSWERGTNENTNGLVRQYFSKGSDLAGLSAEEVKAVEAKLNHRPRKSLDYRTPHEVFYRTRSLLTVALTS